MNWDQIQGKWSELKGSVRKQWGKLTDDDVQQIKGERDRLMGVLQQKYGFAKEEADKQIARFEKNCNC